MVVVSGAPQAVAATCGSSTNGAFAPTRAVISGIKGGKAMVPVGVTSKGALATPPKTTAGLQQIGWYRNRGTHLPGQGWSIPLDAHSYFPNGTLQSNQAGLALGNALLLKFRAGNTITLYNSNGTKHICYRYLSAKSYSPSSRVPMEKAVTSAREQVGIIVCSGQRRSDGTYTSRTLFVAVRP